MDILFQTNKQEKKFNNSKKLVKTHGSKRARLIRRRLDDLHDADTLAEFRHLAGRCHELHGVRKGQLSLDLDGPYRLVFEPAIKPAPKKLDGGLDWDQIRAVCVLEVADTHE